MRIDIFYPNLPPVLDAIGEHNACLASALSAAGAVVRLLHLADNVDSVKGAELVSLKAECPGGYSGLGNALRHQGTDWLITAYNPFSYGHYGVNVRLPLALSAARRTHPSARQALYVHEAFAPARTPRLALMSAAHRAQFAAVRVLSDRVITSSDVWADDFGRWRPKRPTEQIRIGSNLPQATGARREVRRRLGVGDTSLLAVVFGGLGGDRNLDMLTRALQVLRDLNGLCLYVGPSANVFEGVAKRAEAQAVSLGRLNASSAADVLGCADIGLAPFIDGVSPRRGSFLAMLQQGLAVVSTHGPLTGPVMNQAASKGCFRLTDCTPLGFAEGVRAVAQSQSLRNQMGQQGMTFYRESHDWSPIADAYIGTLFPKQTAANG